MTLDDILHELLLNAAKARPKIINSNEDFAKSLKESIKESDWLKNLLNSRDLEFNTNFVMRLYLTMKSICVGNADYGAGHHAIYLGFEGEQKTLDELKREHDLNGFNKKLAPSRKKGGKIRAKKLHEKSRKPDALLVLENWTGDRKDFINFAIDTYEVGERQAGRWWAESKGKP